LPRLRVDRLAVGCAVLACALASFVAWGNRYQLNPDGISYIELARAAAVSGPHAAINGYWSPGYPFLLLPIIAAFHGAAAWVIPAVHVVNLVLCALAVTLFAAVLRGLASRAPAPLARHAITIAVAVGTVTAAEAIGFGLITPDVAVMLIVVAAVACVFALERSRSRTIPFVALGVVLGIGYWIKGILLPLDLLLLLLLLVFPPSVDQARPRLIVAGIVFAIVAAPLFIAVSHHLGRVSAGDVGRLNYAWEVDGITPFSGWQGDSVTRFGAPVHGPRTLWPTPRVIEFATPIPGTYPLWYDPSYWYAGVTPAFDLAGQWSAIRQGALDLGAVLLQQWATIVAAMLVWGATRRRPGGVVRSRMPLVLGLWSAGATILYGAVHIESRYLAGFILVAIAGGWASLVRRDERPRWNLRRAVPAALAVLAISFAINVEENRGAPSPSYRPPYVAEGDSLHALGARAGSPVAAVGDAFEQYATFTAATPVVAQVLDSTGFWAAAPSVRAEIAQRLAQIGIRAMVANNVAAEFGREGWHILARPDSANLGILPLSPP
jgi:hypothetical protein